VSFNYFLNGEPKTKEYDTYGLPSKNCAPVVTEMKAFEEDVIHLVSNVKFRKISDPFLNNIAGDLEKVNSSQNVLIFNLPTKQEMSMKLHPKHITNY
jgi:hypothetical protein